MTTADVTATPVEVSLPGGRAISVRIPDQKFKGLVERRVQANARAAVFADKDELTPDEWAAAYGSYLDRVASEDYRWNGRVCRQFLASDAGTRLLLEHLAGIPPAEHDATLRDRAVVAQLAAAVQEAMAAGNPPAAP